MDEPEKSTFGTTLTQVGLLIGAFFLLKWMLTTKSGFITMCVFIAIIVLANLTVDPKDLELKPRPAPIVNLNEPMSAPVTSNSRCQTYSSGPLTMGGCIQ